MPGMSVNALNIGPLCKHGKAQDGLIGVAMSVECFVCKDLREDHKTALFSRDIIVADVNGHEKFEAGECSKSSCFDESWCCKLGDPLDMCYECEHLQLAIWL